MLVSPPILILLNWKEIFHVHMDASYITMDTILAQLEEGRIANSISFSSCTLFHFLVARSLTHKRIIQQ